MAEKEATSTMTEEQLADLKVRCLTLPIHGMKLLLPNTVVAEVLEYREIDTAARLPKWVLGILSWRGRNVPVVSFERIVGSDISGIHSHETRFIVCNTLTGNNNIPFIALQIEGIPHLAQVDNTLLEYDSAITQPAPAAQAYLRLQGESVIVPKMDMIEKMIENLGFSTGSL